MANIDIFMETYAQKLTEAIQRAPREYTYNVEKVPLVMIRMRQALIKNTYNIDSPSLRATCKALGLTCTYKAIRAYIKEEGNGGDASSTC